MTTALITTTINCPDVLKLYRAFGHNVAFFIAGDRKSPHHEIRALVKGLAPARYYDVEQQCALKYKCSELIGWDTIQRRNIALLEALKCGADVIATVDDDNLPIGSYFGYFSWRFEYPFTGLMASEPHSGWFDVGKLLDPPSPHRGFPCDILVDDPTFLAVTDVRVGVAAGICLGDPDIDAYQRIANRPSVHRISELLRHGIVVDKSSTNTVFNSQNTAFVRDLAPAMFCPPGLGRYDDIWASLIAQRIMRDTNYHVHFGPPFVWQQRNHHSLVRDLKAEVYGMENTLRFALDLEDIDVTAMSVVGRVRKLYQALGKRSYIPGIVSKAGLAFVDDCEKILNG